MGTISTFGTYALARLGIYSAQNSISITGNNISNVNTMGYTRQAPNQISMNSGGADRYQSIYNLRLGNGSLVKNVMQLRDQYLDLRYRDAQADVGAVDATLAIQQQLAAILDEVGTGPDESGVLEAYFSAMEEQLQNMITQGVGDDRYETLFRTAASALVNQLHSYASQLEDLAEKTAEEFESDVSHVNEILTNIRELNVQIRKSQIFGSDPLELLDARNNLIDELSYYMDIRVTIEQEDTGNGEYVDRMVIRTVPADDGEEQVLIYGVYGAQLSILNDGDYKDTYALQLSKLKNIYGAVYSDATTEEADGETFAKAVGQAEDPNGRDFKLTFDETSKEYILSYTDENGDQMTKSFDADALQDCLAQNLPTEVTENGMKNQYSYDYEVGADGRLTVITTNNRKSTSYTFTDTELHGALQSEREMLTESGNFWLSLNSANENEAYLKADPNGDTKRGIPYYRQMLDVFAERFAEMMNEANRMDRDPDAVGEYVLFSNSGSGNDPSGITAKNIAISKNWANGSTYVVHGVEVDGELSTDSTNLLRMLGILQSEDHEFFVDNPDAVSGRERFFKGSFQQLFTNHTVGNLATDISRNTIRLDNYENVREEVYTERDGVSGVYLDDEAMNMMQYQQAYNAACRLMTTFDEMIDKLVNGM